MAFYTFILIASAIALVLVATALNVAVHIPRTRDSKRNGRHHPAPLSTAGLVEEAGATIAAIFGSVITTATAGLALSGRSHLGDGAPQIVVLPEVRVPRHASWLLQRRLRQRGWHITVHTGSRAHTGDPEALDRISQSILERCRAEGSVTLLGIGGGGLLARQLAVRQPRFRRVLTLATPHRGTVTAIAPPHLRPDSPYVSGVATTEPTPRPFDAIAIYSEADAWIEPIDGAYYPGAFNVVVKDVGHLASLFSTSVFRLVAENLEAVLSPVAPDAETG